MYCITWHVFTRVEHGWIDWMRSIRFDSIQFNSSLHPKMNNLFKEIFLSHVIVYFVHLHHVNNFNLDPLYDPPFSLRDGTS